MAFYKYIVSLKYYYNEIDYRNSTFLFLYSCQTELIENVPNDIEKGAPQSRTIYDFSLNHPKFMVTGNYYIFTLTGVPSYDFQSIYWSLNGEGSILDLGRGSVDALFDKGGWHSFRIDFYDFSYNHWWGNTEPFPVYQKAPMIVSKSGIIDTEENYIFTVDYPHIGKYDIEWEFTDGVHCISSTNTQAVLSFPSVGTYTIKCRAKEECPCVNGGVYVSDWGTLNVSVVPKLIPNQWTIRNIQQLGNEIFYDIMYKNTTSSKYICESLYTTFLYEGAYDGYYGGFSLDWIYNTKFGLYFPYSVNEDYGFEMCAWDYYDGGLCAVVETGQIFSTLVKGTTTSNKTLSDIEYVLFFIYDNKQSYRYVDEGGFIE